jgi:hypothetical protein
MLHVGLESGLAFSRFELYWRPATSLCLVFTDFLTWSISLPELKKCVLKHI